MIQGQSVTTSHARLMPHQFPSNRELGNLSDSTLPSLLLLSVALQGMENLFGQFGSPPCLSHTPVYPLGVSRECFHAAQMQYLKSCSVISTAGALTVKMTFTPARPSTKASGQYLADNPNSDPPGKPLSPFNLALGMLLSFHCYVTSSEERQMPLYLS